MKNTKKPNWKEQYEVAKGIYESSLTEGTHLTTGSAIPQGVKLRRSDYESLVHSWVIVKGTYYCLFFSDNKKRISGQQTDAQSIAPIGSGHFGIVKGGFKVETKKGIPTMSVLS